MHHIQQGSIHSIVSIRPLASQWHGFGKNSMSRVLDLDPFPRNSLWDESSDTLRTARSDMAVGTWEQGSLPVGRVKNTLERTVQDICVHRSVCVQSTSAHRVNRCPSQISPPHHPAATHYARLLGRWDLFLVGLLSSRILNCWSWSVELCSLLGKAAPESGTSSL